MRVRHAGDITPCPPARPRYRLHSLRIAISNHEHAPAAENASVDAGSPDRRRARAGLVYALIAYLWWGFVPIYFKLVAHVPPLVVLAHRVMWSVVFLAAIITLQRRWRETRVALRSRRLLLTLAGSTVFIALNWLVFIYAISTNRLLQASLGYFINPLLTVALAIIFLKERLRAAQAIALAIAAAGVIMLAVRTGQTPWLALSMALTFGCYGLLRKIAPVTPLAGLMIETTLLLPMALAVAVWHPMHDSGGDGSMPSHTYPLLMLA